MKKLLLLGVFVLIIGANARQQPKQAAARIIAAEPTVSTRVTGLQHDVALLDSSLTILRSAR